MSQALDIDGVLVQWGDRLFYPGNRVVQVEPQPRLWGGSSHERADMLFEPGHQAKSIITFLVTKWLRG